MEKNTIKTERPEETYDFGIRQCVYEVSGIDRCLILASSEKDFDETEFVSVIKAKQQEDGLIEIRIARHFRGYETTEYAAAYMSNREARQLRDYLTQLLEEM